MKVGANQFTEGRSIDRPSVSETQAAEIMKVSVAQVRRAKRIKREAPELLEQIKAGSGRTSLFDGTMCCCET